MTAESYPGVYRAECAAVDAAPSTRIKVRVPQLLGKSVLGEWALACVPPGWDKAVLKDHVFTDNDTGMDAGGSATETLHHVQHQLTPKVGQGCWVMFEGGDVNHPVWIGVLGA